VKRSSNKECCKHYRYVKFKGTMTKWPVQKLTHRTTQKHIQHHDETKFGHNTIFGFGEDYVEVKTVDGHATDKDRSQ